MPTPVTNISPIESLAQKLLHLEELGLPPSLLNALQDVARKANECMTEKAALLLHNLDERKHSKVQVKIIIDTFPEALSHKDRNGHFPIQNASLSLRRVSFLPILAQEGNHSNVGGEGNRGGLLLKSPSASTKGQSGNLIQTLSRNITENASEEEKLLQVLRRLKSMGLLHKEDIAKYNLLKPNVVKGFSQHEVEQRFDFLASWDPKALKEANETGIPLLNYIASSKNSPRRKKMFGLFLKASMKHFPQELGLLFQKHNQVSAFEAALVNYGQHETMKIIQSSIPPSDTCPHEHPPKYAHVSSRHSPDAMCMRDSNKRTLFQATLASSKKSFADHAPFVQEASD